MGIDIKINIDEKPDGSEYTKLSAQALMELLSDNSENIPTSSYEINRITVGILENNLLNNERFISSEHWFSFVISYIQYVTEFLKKINANFSLPFTFYNGNLIIHKGDLDNEIKELLFKYTQLNSLYIKFKSSKKSQTESIDRLFLPAFSSLGTEIDKLHDNFKKL